MNLISNSTEETIEIGKKIAAKLRGGDIVLLYGELGAGKSTMIRGIAQKFGIKKNILSPTFTLMNVYELKKPLNKVEKIAHVDTYRLKNLEEFLEIGAEDYVGASNTLTIIEWPEKIMDLFKDKKTIKIELTSISETQRKIISSDF